MNPIRSAVCWAGRSPVRAFLLIFLPALAIRCYFLTLVPQKYILVHTDQEMEAVAASLAVRGEFADPYALPTGPTAHLPPLGPMMLGLIYRLFGLTLAAGYAGWLIRLAFQSAVCGLLPWFSEKLGAGRQAGLLGGIAGAFWVQWPGHAEAPTAMALGLLLVAFVARWKSAEGSAGGSLLLGLAAGAALHLQPVLLPVVLGCLAYEVWRRRERRRRLLAAAVVVGMAVACIPWGVRNYRVFGAVFFIRSNLGLELRMGHHDGARVTMHGMDAIEPAPHPRTHRSEARKVQELGEIEYMRRARGEALAWIRAHPSATLRLTAGRFVHWWFGPLHDPVVAAFVTLLTLLAAVGAWRLVPAVTGPQRATILIPLATYPLIYYVVPYMIRYRVPIDWMLLMLAGAAVWRWLGGEPGDGRARSARTETGMDGDDA